MKPVKRNFNELVNLAMASPALSAMRPVVEKEILHARDIPGARR